MTNLRRVERFEVDGPLITVRGQPRTTGAWNRVEFKELKKGDVFRTWNSVKPEDEGVDKFLDVSVALTNPELAKDASDESDNYYVKCLPVNGFVNTQKGYVVPPCS